ncbi:MAG: methylmalonyl-CoA epimerase [Dehalococcoidales bacterium]|nr:methylmalonyl-CoA epimerase [Dehalococcoidales bacterium]
MIRKIDHIGIAVKNLDEALKLYTDILDLEVDAIETLEEQKVKTAVINVGESKIELLEATSPDSTIATFIEKRGEGIHHLALGVNNLEKSLDSIRTRNIPLIDQKPRKGVQNTRIAFVHPKGAKILLELVET